MNYVPVPDGGGDVPPWWYWLLALAMFVYGGRMIRWLKYRWARSRHAAKTQAFKASRGDLQNAFIKNVALDPHFRRTLFQLSQLSIPPRDDLDDQIESAVRNSLTEHS